MYLGFFYYYFFCCLFLEKILVCFFPSRAARRGHVWSKQSFFQRNIFIILTINLFFQDKKQVFYCAVILFWENCTDYFFLSRKSRMTKNNNFSLFFHDWSQVIVFSVISCVLFCFLIFHVRKKKISVKIFWKFFILWRVWKVFFRPRECFSFHVWSKVTWTWCEDGDFFFPGG